MYTAVAAQHSLHSMSCILMLQVTLPPALTGAITSADPKIRELQEQLNDVNRKILNNELDIPPEGERSPSPPPRYDQNGQRLNTREVRYKDKLMDRRSFLIEEMIKADPSYRPPADYRPRKKERKIFIPQKDYPGYNFIGLIIGPRGNTQKRMQKETSTKIAIRGRGSVKEGAARDPKYDYGEEEELHVLISGDTQQDVSMASLQVPAVWTVHRPLCCKLAHMLSLRYAYVMCGACISVLNSQSTVCPELHACLVISQMTHM